MTGSKHGRRVGGRERLLDIAAERFQSLVLDDLLPSRLSGTALATYAGVAPGTVYHHFPGGQQPGPDTLMYASAQRALDLATASHGECSCESGALIDAIERLRDGDPKAVDQIAQGLVHDLLFFSPDIGPAGTVAAAENAFFLLCAVAPTDPVARKIAREYCHPNMASYRTATERLLDVTGRVMADGITIAEFATITGALSDGLTWQRRYMLADVPAELMWTAWARLFTASTRPTGRNEESDRKSAIPDPLAAFQLDAPQSSGARLDEEKRRRIIDAAVARFANGGWEAVTIASVAELAEVSQNTVRANVGSRTGLAALLWGQRHMPNLLATTERQDLSPIDRISTVLIDIASICQSHSDREITKSLLEGVFDYGSVHGSYTAGDVADPRHYVPLADVLVPLLTLQSGNFRPGYADTAAALVDTASLLVNQVMYLAMVSGGLANPASTRPTMIAHRVIDTTLRGMLKRSSKG